ncbi:MAG: hypothetical protein ABF876_05405 [Acetobacter aceti]
MPGHEQYLVIIFVIYWGIGTYLATEKQLFSALKAEVGRRARSAQYVGHEHILYMAAFLVLLFASLAWPYFVWRENR